MVNCFKRIELEYTLEHLEPIISSQTMYYHYEVLHKNYEVKLAEILQGTEVKKNFPSLENLMQNLDKLPSNLRPDVQFFGGGVINHNFFFSHLTKAKDRNEREISSELVNLIKNKFASLENLMKELVNSALKVRGSGWTWLVLDANKQLTIINTANQDNPWSLDLHPLLAIDVWEHAYFLDYGTNRKEYVEKMLNLLNWKHISENYLLISKNIYDR